MSLFRNLVSLSCVLSLLSPQWVWARQARHQNQNTNKFSSEEVRFMLSYKAYVKILLHMQAAETKKKLVCLGADDVFDLSVLPGMTGEISNLIAAYRQSEECQKFLNEGVFELRKNHSLMRVYLALHQSSQSEVQQRGYVMDALGQRLEPVFDCSLLEFPIAIGPTEFCFQELHTILNVRPKHILKKFSLPFLDKGLNHFSSYRGIPEIVPLVPLTWEEVIHGTLLFQQAFSDHPEFSERILAELEQDFDSEVLATLSKRQLRQAERFIKHETNKRQNEAFFKNYASATEMQAQGIYVFSDYPEESAPKKYVDILTQFPVLAFYDPVKIERSLDCESSDPNSEVVKYNLKNLCFAYKDNVTSTWSNASLVNSFSNDLERHVYPKMIEAFKKVLDLNLILLKTLDLEYETNSMYNATKTALAEVGVENINTWANFISMETALDSFLFQFPEFEGLEERFLQIHQRRELVKMGLMIGGAVALGFGCGLLGGWPLLGCLVAAGAGVNTAFYGVTLQRHNDLLAKYFSTSTHETADGVKLGLVEFESLRTEVQGLYMDSLFMFVGLGAGQIKRLSKQLIEESRRTKGLR